MQTGYVIDTTTQMDSTHGDDAHVTIVADRFDHPSVQHVHTVLHNGNDHSLREHGANIENPDVGKTPYVKGDVPPNSDICNERNVNGSIDYTAKAVGHDGT